MDASSTRTHTSILLDVISLHQQSLEHQALIVVVHLGWENEGFGQHEELELTCWSLLKLLQLKATFMSLHVD